MFKDNKLRLLMTLVGFQRLGDEEDADATWVIPPSITAAELRQCIDLIKKFENDPPVFDDDKVAADFIRRKQALKARHSIFGDEDDDDADFLENDEAEFLFPAGGPTNRKPDALKELKAKRQRRRRPKGSDDDEGPDEAELEARREKRRKTNLEKMRAIKSDLYVHDSDDASDEEKDRLFFDKEAELRREYSKKVLEAMRLEAENDKNPLGAGLKGKGKKRKIAGGDIATNSKTDNPPTKSAKRRKSAREPYRPSLIGPNSDSDSPSSSSNKDPDLDLISLPSSSSDEEDTLLTSSPQVAQLSLSPHPTKDTDGDTAMQDEDEDEDIPVRRRARIGGFVVDSDSE
jgi:replication fork protection complex subunit Tof1/Swi1